MITAMILMYFTTAFMYFLWMRLISLYEVGFVRTLAIPIIMALLWPIGLCINLGTIAYDYVTGKL